MSAGWSKPGLLEQVPASRLPLSEQDTKDEFSDESPVDIVQAADTLQAVGRHFQRCIDSLEELLEERENLIRELIFVKEPMIQEVCDLRAKLLVLFQGKSEAEIECENYKEEIKSTKRKLFEIIKTQMTYKHAVSTSNQSLPQMALEQEALESEAQLLSDELAVLKDRQQEEINKVIHKLENIRNTINIVSRSKGQQTDEFQNILAEQRQWLQKYYEPKLENLMKWDQSRTESLRHTQQEVKGFRQQLQVVLDQGAKLSTQKQFLQRQLQATHEKRGQDIALYQTQIRELEAKVSILKTELIIQKKKNDNMRIMKESLLEELAAYRCKTCLHVGEKSPNSPFATPA
ncbi:syncoilin isoform X2 [Mobula birostris]|uniref:syncoilin isoform X2 n=1 Tax=Mobula birostris TaxID=1983395 RepID=UPI003B28672E